MNLCGLSFEEGQGGELADSHQPNRLIRKKVPSFYGLCLTRSLDYVKLPGNTMNYLFG